MGFFKSLFSSPQSVETQTPEEVSAEKKRIAFETLRDSGIRAMNIKEYKLAADYFQKALELNPDDSETKALLAEAYLNSGEMEKALELLRPLAEENPDNPKIRISIAQAALQLKDWDEVLAASAEAEHLNPENPSVYYFEGMAYNGMEDYDNAVAKFSQAIALANDYAAAIVMRARCYAAQEKFEEAEKDIDQLINNNQADDYVFIQKGNLCKAREDYENAADAYRKALEINPFNVEAYILEAETYEIMGNDAKALAVYNEGVDYMPGRRICCGQGLLTKRKTATMQGRKPTGKRLKNIPRRKMRKRTAKNSPKCKTEWKTTCERLILSDFNYPILERKQKL